MYYGTKPKPLSKQHTAYTGRALTKDETGVYSSSLKYAIDSLAAEVAEAFFLESTMAIIHKNRSIRLNDLGFDIGEVFRDWGYNSPRSDRTPEWVQDKLSTLDEGGRSALQRVYAIMAITDESQ
jgi:hypothetical protein